MKIELRLDRLDHDARLTMFVNNRFAGNLRMQENEYQQFVEFMEKARQVSNTAFKFKDGREPKE